ncbi:anterior gradient protein 3-like [Gracilinanus agilis]|uniref:anterior gradient protein 3-like n=1 Tax=Gracilinanus agilis TaxID=191870 RepID=UPI001CFDFA42|nr:anterior gradient protein 3-like [Gracilinanus agilis]
MCPGRGNPPGDAEDTGRASRYWQDQGEPLTGYQEGYLKPLGESAFVAIQVGLRVTCSFVSIKSHPLEVGTFRRKTLLPGTSVSYAQSHPSGPPKERMPPSALSFALLLLAVSSSITEAVKRAPQTLSRGWGDDITWVQTYEEGLFQAKKSNKPLMVIHHLEDCQYCQALKKVFAKSDEIQEMAQSSFVMLNLMVGEINMPDLFPKGNSIPLSFTDPSLTVRADITGRYSNRLYTYEPQDLPVLIENMKKALQLIQKEL